MRKKLKEAWESLLYIGKALLAGVLPVVAVIGGMLYFFLVMPSAPREYEFLHPTEEIVKMEIAYCDEQLYGLTNDTGDSTFADQFSVVKRLDEAQWEPVLTDLMDNSVCRKWTNDPNPTLQGNILRITYEDGCQELLSWGGTYRLSRSTEEASGFTWYNFDETFHEILEKYIK